MSNMIYGAAYHSLFVVKNKWFVIGEATNKCQVFDNTSKIFVALKSKMKYVYTIEHFNKSINFGGRIYVYFEYMRLCYDVEKDEWLKDSFAATKKLSDYSIVGIPTQ